MEVERLQRPHGPQCGEGDDAQLSHPLETRSYPAVGFHVASVHSIALRSLTGRPSIPSNRASSPTEQSRPAVSGWFVR